jgi:phosphoketolase
LKPPSFIYAASRAEEFEKLAKFASSSETWANARDFWKKDLGLALFARIDIDDHVFHEGRVMEVLSEHNCHGWLEGHTLTGRHGLFATYEAFAMVVDSMAMQHARIRDWVWSD